jgi:exodeoxyribonuclease VII large subunit
MVREMEEVKEKIYSVREITRIIKFTIEQELGSVWVRGEISNFKAHPSGHFYFSLKDEHSQLACVMFRDDNRKLIFKPEDGMSVTAFGRIGVYEKQGAYQLYVHEMKPEGIGELALKFEALKKKLKAEGLFEKEHKKPLPEFPLRIGIVTASTGAAIRDIINILNRRAPYVQAILRPVRVQGDSAAWEISQAIAEFNSYGDVDLLIVGRGGGSMEDLWAFNEEIVARAIFASSIPVISAVGHEIDFTIADFVADMRAPTPSAAAELAVSDREELIEAIEHRLATCQRLLFAIMDQKGSTLQHFLKRYGIARVIDMINQKRQTVDDHERRFTSTLSHSFLMQAQRYDGLSKRLLGLNPSSVLRRGYTITRKLPDMHIVSSIRDINLYDRLSICFSDGKTRVIVDKKMRDAKKKHSKEEGGKT